MPDPVQTSSNSAVLPGDGATSGGQTAPVPTSAFTADQYNGMKGNYEHQLSKSRAAADEFKGKADALESQMKALQTEIEVHKGKAAQADEMTRKYAELEAQSKASTSLNAKMATLMKYPALLDENGLEMVRNLNLEGEALEKVLGSLAAKVANTPIPANLGATPPQPASSSVTPQSLRDEANNLARSGKYNESLAKLSEAAKLQDKLHGANLPPIDVRDNVPLAAPPVG